MKTCLSGLQYLITQRATSSKISEQTGQHDRHTEATV